MRYEGELGRKRVRRLSLEPRLLEVLERPCFRMDLVRMLRVNDTTVIESLKRLWRQGKVLRSRRMVSVSYVESKPGVGQYWCKFAGYLWIRADSPLLKAGGMVDVELPHTERYTLKHSKRKVSVMFSPFVLVDVKKGWLSQKEVLEFFKSRDVGAASGEVAELFKVPVNRASSVLRKMRRRGVLEQRGYWNPALARETPFRGAIKGYVYGLAGTDQAKKRVEQGRGLYSPHVNAMLVEIRKDSSQKRFTPYSKFEEEIGQFETLKAIKILTQIYPDLVTTTIGGLGLIYDRRAFTPEDIERQTRFWQDRVSRKKMMAGALGTFHEAFAQRGVDVVLKGMKIQVTFWRRIVRGREHYDIRLSNGKQIDRVCQVDFYHKDKLLWSHYYPMEMKFYRGGATSDHVREFLDKLRFSSEFGEYVELQEGNQTFLVHMVKQNVFPILISPYFRKDTYALAKKYHVELVPTWLLAKLAGETIRKPLDVKKLFDQYMKQGGGPIEQFLNETFKIEREVKK